MSDNQDNYLINKHQESIYHSKISISNLKQIMSLENIIVDPYDYGLTNVEIDNFNILSISYMSCKSIQYIDKIYDILRRRSEQGIVSYVLLCLTTQINSTSRLINTLYGISETNITELSLAQRDIDLAILFEQRERRGPIYYILRHYSEVTKDYLKFINKYKRIKNEWGYWYQKVNFDSISSLDYWMHNNYNIINKNKLNRIINYEEDGRKEYGDGIVLLYLLNSYYWKNIIRPDGKWTTIIWLCAGYYNISFKMVEQLTRKPINVHNEQRRNDIIANIAFTRGIIDQCIAPNNLKIKIDDEWIYNIAKKMHMKFNMIIRKKNCKGIS